MTILTQKLTPKEKEGYKLAHLCPLSQGVGDLKKKKDFNHYSPWRVAM